MTLLHKHKINGGFLAPDRIPMEERNKNEMILELQKENHRLHSIIKEVREYIENNGHYDFYNLDVAVDGEKLLEILDKENI